MNSSRTFITAVALAGTLGLSACTTESSSAHSSSGAKKTSSSSPTSSATSSASSGAAPSPTPTPSVSSLITKMQSNLRNAKSLHLHATGRDVDGTLLDMGSQDVSVDLEGALSGDPNDVQLKSGGVSVEIRMISGLHYVKADSAFWTAASKKGGGDAFNPRIKAYADKWLKTPASMTSFDDLSMPKLLDPMKNDDLSGSDGLTDLNTDVSATSLHGTPCWKLSNKDGEGNMWISQKTGDILEFKLSDTPTPKAPLNDFTFSDVNKDFNITVPVGAVAP